MTSLAISMLLNVGSLVLGTASWLFGFLAIRASCPGRYPNSVISFILCAVSLFCQLGEVCNRAAVGDFAAIGDTIRAVLLAAAVLVIVTAALNLAALRINRNE